MSHALTSLRKDAALAAFSVCLGFSVSACGGASTPPAQSSADTSKKESSATEKQTVQTPLTAVEAPDNIFLRARVRNPAALADGLFDALSLPFDWRKLAQNEDDKLYMKAVDLEAPVDMIAALNSRRPQDPHRIVSIGAFGVDVVLSQLDENGVETTEASGGIHHFRWERQLCSVGRAISGSPARIVCSDNEESLRYLSAYAFRGFPALELSSADVHLELDMRPLRATYGKELARLKMFAAVGARQLHVGHAKYDQAITDSVVGLADEASALLQDTELLTAQIFEEKGSFRVLFSGQFGAQNSTTVQTLQALEKTQAQAPPLFDALPSTASSAGYEREVNAQDAEAWMSVLVDLATGRVEYEGASSEFSSRLGQLIQAWGPQGDTTVFAQGPLIATLNDKEKELRPSYRLMGTTMKKSKVVAALDNISWLLSSRDLKRMISGVQDFPQLKRIHSQLRGVPGASLYRWSVPKRLSNEVLSADRSIGAPWVDDTMRELVEDLSEGYVAVHQLDGHTWVSWGADKSSVAESLNAVAAKDSQKLGAMGSLGGVRDEEAVSASFVKLEGLAGILAWAIPDQIVDTWPGLLRATPARGAVPGLFFFRIAGGPRTLATWEAQIPVEFSRDLTALILMIGTEAGLNPNSWMD